MSSNLNSVKSEDRYHHGALREALLAAAEEIIAERGVEGFSLRETARRAGVSPAAPAHHFGDMRGLLTGLATSAFRDLGDALAAADAAGKGDREARIRAQGTAYVEFALTNPARFELMWRRGLLDTGDAEYAAAARRAFSYLEAAVEDRPVEEGKVNPPRLVDPGTIASWAMVQGFSRLALDGAFGLDREEAAERARAALPHVLDRLKLS